ncbi:hypothetical protein QE152_g26799 [Popillia japonica]|uniref:Uncharacterized protein n=1 Tax=Popillia japonica TaxID=7064 RepID=A0AAW1JX82_POPJA
MGYLRAIEGIARRESPKRSSEGRYKSGTDTKKYRKTTTNMANETTEGDEQKATMQKVEQPVSGVYGGERA